LATGAWIPPARASGALSLLGGFGSAGELRQPLGDRL
jgi:hypothetical protein